MISTKAPIHQFAPIQRTSESRAQSSGKPMSRPRAAPLSLSVIQSAGVLWLNPKRA